MNPSFLRPGDVNAFREYQTRSTILVERERAVEARRLAVQGLRQAVSQLQSENSFRREKIQLECSSVTEKQNIQDEKIKAKEMQITAAKNHLEAVVAEEQRLHSLLLSLETQIQTDTKELEKRIALKDQINGIREETRNLRSTLEEKDAALLLLQEKVQREATQAQKRYGAIEEEIKKCARLEDVYEQYMNKENHEKLSTEEIQRQVFTTPPFWGCKAIRLSQLDENAASPSGRRSSQGVGDDYLGGESVLLVDE